MEMEDEAVRTGQEAVCGTGGQRGYLLQRVQVFAVHVFLELDGARPEFTYMGGRHPEADEKSGVVMVLRNRRREADDDEASRDAGSVSMGQFVPRELEVNGIIRIRQ